MKLTELTNSMSRSINKIGFSVKKHSPEILVVAGVVGTVTSAVMACKATTKLSAILDETKDTIDKVHETAQNPEYADKYSEEDAKKDLTIIYAQTGLKLVKLYAPAIILGAVSLAAVVTSNNILRKRNVALAAAYTVVDKGFKEYRGRVVERFGKDLDRELRFGVKAEEIETTVVNEETGKEEIVKETVSTATIPQYSEYAKVFDETCPNWEKNAEYNLMFLKNQERYANERLRGKGSLFLNEVYDMLGFPRTEAGSVIGWIYNKDTSYVDFGIYNLDNERARAFVNGYEKSIILDFNVDGVIYNLLP